MQNQSVISHEHQLPDGCILELLEMRPAGTDPTRTSAQPPLLFIHGASHGAWCWSVSVSIASQVALHLNRTWCIKRAARHAQVPHMQHFSHVSMSGLLGSSDKERCIRTAKCIRIASMALVLSALTLSALTLTLQFGVHSLDVCLHSESS